jgi:hypothetical protein
MSNIEPAMLRARALYEDIRSTTDLLAIKRAQKMAVALYQRTYVDIQVFGSCHLIHLPPHFGQ